MTRGYSHGLAALEPQSEELMGRIAKRETNRGMMDQKKIEGDLVLHGDSLIGRCSFMFIAGSLPDRLS